MRRYWIDKPLKLNENFQIDQDLFKHIFIVCRRQEGDRFELINESKANFVEVLEVKDKKATVKVLEQRDLPKLKKPYLHLVLSFSQPKVIERVLEKSVELGVKSLRLVSTDRSFLKKSSALQTKTKRLEKIKKQALQQSGRGEDLELKEPLSLNDFLSIYEKHHCQKDKGFFFFEGNSNALLEETDLKGSAEESDGDIVLFVGSEGGFTKEEAQSIQSAGFKTCSLGEQILRVETACVAGISILKSKFNLW